jgi:[NiFe] hydrogenase assembly HybE family chaperone
VSATASLEVDALVAHFRRVADERMRGLPIVNPRLEVEAAGFRDFDEHRLGILIAPWFMNMVLLPGNDDWATLAQGDKVMIDLPAGEFEFTVCRDEALPGAYLSAVLFRTTVDFPDQHIARDVALDVAERLFQPPADDETPGEDAREAGSEPPRYNRRALLSGQGSR